MKIWHSDYQLIPVGAASSGGKIPFRKGSLLRIDFGDSKVGYADLCPFSAFGDAPLEVQLGNLQNEKYSNLIQSSLDCALMDAEARLAGQSLYTESRIKNHFLITDLVNFDLNRIPVLQGQRYTDFKIKLGRNIMMETEMLRALTEKLSSDSRIRLDFNHQMSISSFGDWLESNADWLKPCTEFIEDPFKYSVKEWKAIYDDYQIPLALDFFDESKVDDLSSAQVLVIKPALQDSSKLTKMLGDHKPNVVFTHYMDFPVGQMFALISAQRFQKESDLKVLSCGLQSQEVYESFQFQDLIRNDGPYVVPPEGKGLGFDLALERQEWRSLT